MGEARPRARAGRALVALACLVAASLAWAMSPPRAGATEDVTTQRLAGPNRYATAASAARSAYPDGAATVVLASGDAFADALAGSALAGALDGPLVLTAGDELSPEARQAIDQLGAGAVVILGGPGAVSEAIERDLDEELDVSRVSGADRYATAAAAAGAIGADDVATHDGLRTAIVASGISFADALAGGGIANAGSGAGGVHPVLLVDGGVPSSTAAAIDELGIEQVVILGGSAAVSSEVEAALETQTGNPAIRLAGANRYATGVAVAEAMINDFGSPATVVLLASGESFPDALAAGVLSGRVSAPTLLTPQVALAREAEDFLVEHASTVGQIIALGGTSAVSATALEEAEAAAETVPEEEAAAEDAEDPITVAPSGPATQRNNTTRSYTASGLDDLDEVDVVLLPCANVTASASGHAFRNSNANGVADGGAEGGASPDRASTVARISSVNGASASLVNDDYADDVEPKADGTVAFAVSGPSSSTAAGGCVRPVVFDDADGDSTLDTTTANPSTGSEDLGVGGATTFNPDSGGGGSGSGGGSSTPQLTDHGTRNVSRHAIDEGGNDPMFEACRFLQGSGSSQVEQVDYGSCDSFRYDTDDTFRTGAASLTFAEFENALTAGDDITIRLCRGTSVGCSSVFTLVDESPGSPTEVSAAADGDDVAVSFREPVSTVRSPSEDDPDGDGAAYYRQSLEAADGFRLYRAEVASSESCPTALARYGHVDGATGGAPRLTNTPNELTDPDPPTGKLCYVVVAVQDGDESAPSAPDEITMSTGSSSTLPFEL